MRVDGLVGGACDAAVGEAQHRVARKKRGRWGGGSFLRSSRSRSRSSRGGRCCSDWRCATGRCYGHFAHRQEPEALHHHLKRYELDGLVCFVSSFLFLFFFLLFSWSILFYFIINSQQ
jgi:hypothetical protein